MGLLQLVRAADELGGRSRERAHAPAIRSPWASSTLSRVVWDDVFGDAAHVPITRAAAMRVPACARGRHMLVSTVAGLPLRAYRGPDALATQPTWLYRTNGAVSPELRMAWTVDDLVFYGWSLWAVERGARGAITDADRVPIDCWRFDDDSGGVLVYEQAVSDESVVLIPGYHEGLLDFGAATLRTSTTLERTAADRAGNVAPAVELHQTDDGELEDHEVDDLIQGYIDARQDPNGAVVYTPSNVELKLHGSVGHELLIQARNAAAIDVARLLGMPAAMIDASNVNSTLTYETTAGRSLEFRDYSLALYTGPIAARLSLDDCVPAGTRVRFDTSDLIAPVPSPSGPTQED